MQEKLESETCRNSRRQLQGLPLMRADVAGIDIGSERHWVCAPTPDGNGREIADFGATTAELIRMAEWLQARRVQSAAMESTGVYWILGRTNSSLLCCLPYGLPALPLPQDPFRPCVRIRRVTLAATPHPLRLRPPIAPLRENPTRSILSGKHHGRRESHRPRSSAA